MVTHPQTGAHSDGAADQGSPGVNLLVSVYLALFFTGFLFIFWQLSTRWPSS